MCVLISIVLERREMLMSDLWCVRVKVTFHRAVLSLSRSLVKTMNNRNTLTCRFMSGPARGIPQQARNGAVEPHQAGLQTKIKRCTFLFPFSSAKV